MVMEVIMFFLEAASLCAYASSCMHFAQTVKKYGDNLELSLISLQGSRLRIVLAHFCSFVVFADSKVLVKAARDHPDQSCPMNFLSSLYIASVVNFLSFLPYLWKMLTS